MNPFGPTSLAAGLVALCLSGSVAIARADELTTLSGRTFHDVVPMRVEPDGVTWRHASGVCKVDFTDSPEAVRRVYHYDTAKAAAYQAAQEHARAETATHNEQLLREDDARLRARLQAAVAANGTASGPNGFSYRRSQGILPPHSERMVGEQFEAFHAREQAFRDDIGTIADPYVWASVPPAVMFLARLFNSGGGANQSPGVVGFNSFPNTNYAARDYNQGVDYSDHLLGKTK